LGSLNKSVDKLNKYSNSRTNAKRVDNFFEAREVGPEETYRKTNYKASIKFYLHV
jgi:hypothetical protein